MENISYMGAENIHPAPIVISGAKIPSLPLELYRRPKDNPAEHGILIGIELVGQIIGIPEHGKGGICHEAAQAYSGLHIEIEIFAVGLVAGRTFHIGGYCTFPYWQVIGNITVEP